MSYLFGIETMRPKNVGSRILNLGPRHKSKVVVVPGLRLFAFMHFFMQGNLEAPTASAKCRKIKVNSRYLNKKLEFGIFA